MLMGRRLTTAKNTFAFYKKRLLFAFSNGSKILTTNRGDII